MTPPGNDSLHDASTLVAIVAATGAIWLKFRKMFVSEIACELKSGGLDKKLDKNDLDHQNLWKEVTIIGKQTSKTLGILEGMDKKIKKRSTD